jgi:hypothetical protein
MDRETRAAVVERIGEPEVPEVPKVPGVPEVLGAKCTGTLGTPGALEPEHS